MVGTKSVPCTTDVTNGAAAAASSLVAQEGHATATARAHAAGAPVSARNLQRA